MISVAMAVYNGALYIEKQLDSILAQTYHVDEIVLTDDRSTDDSVAIIEKYIQDHPDAGIRFYKNEKNLGYKRNFRKALSLCSGEYIFLCDQDDIWMPEKVGVMLEVMRSRPEIRCLSSSFEVIDGEGKAVYIEPMEGRSNHNLVFKPVEPNEIVPMTMEEFLQNNYFQGCALVITKDLRNEFVDRFSDLLPHDWVINIIASHDHGMYFYNRPLIYYRIHGRNVIGLPEAKIPLKKKLKQVWQYSIRSRFALERGNALSIYKFLYPKEYNANPQNEELRSFYQKHVEYLNHADLKGLISQNQSPYYAAFKSRNARIMDLLFAVKRKITGK